MHIRIHLSVEFATIGIGVHHAGLSMDDRRATEQLFLKKVLRILVATSVCVIYGLWFVTHAHLQDIGGWSQSTCAASLTHNYSMVEFISAAHMVIIKGVHTFQNNASKEYSDLDIMQMLGRAGRPQFGIDLLFS